MPRNAVMNCTSIEELSALEYIDTRDLEMLRRELADAASDAPAADDIAASYDAEDKAELLKLLNELESEVGEWSDGNTLIRESEWEDYCQEFAKDCGYLPNDDGNPLLNCIDWEKWAGLMRQDFSECEIGGVTYLYRQ